ARCNNGPLAALDETAKQWCAGVDPEQRTVPTANLPVISRWVAKLIFNHQRLALINNTRYGEPILPADIRAWILRSIPSLAELAVCLTTAPPEHRACHLVSISSFRSPHNASALFNLLGFGFFIFWDSPTNPLDTARTRLMAFATRSQPSVSTNPWV